MNQVEIQLTAIAKKYPDGKSSFNQVLRGVNMNVERSDFVAIKGASGSGTTTLLSIIGTLLQPDEGSYRLDGVEMNAPGLDYSVIRNKKIGFVFQDHRLLPQLTALENILLPTLAFQNRTGEAQMNYAKLLMELTDITAVAAQYPDTLSGGEACRTALCRALIMKPALLLADEPTGQLDADNAHNVALLLTKINKELGTTILMVTHADETAAIAHKILTLQNGGLS
jgi:ABC-type lipoprotein export system ATPase subunit